MEEDKKDYCVYILSCSDDSLYTGMTCCDLDRLLSDHGAGRGAQWTRKRRPVELVFSLDDLSYRSACEVERYIKTLTRPRAERAETDIRRSALEERLPNTLNWAIGWKNIHRC